MLLLVMVAMIVVVMMVVAVVVMMIALPKHWLWSSIIPQQSVAYPHSCALSLTPVCVPEARGLRPFGPDVLPLLSRAQFDPCRV